MSVQLQRTSELSFLVAVQTDHQGGSYRGGSAVLYRRPSVGAFTNGLCAFSVPNGSRLNLQECVSRATLSPPDRCRGSDTTVFTTWDYQCALSRSNPCPALTSAGICLRDKLSPAGSQINSTALGEERTFLAYCSDCNSSIDASGQCACSYPPSAARRRWPLARCRERMFSR